MNSKQDNDFVEFWYRQYSTYLFRYACLFVDSHTAEEVVQETFRIVCEKGPLDQIEHPKTWLRKITGTRKMDDHAGRCRKAPR